MSPFNKESFPDHCGKRSPYYSQIHQLYMNCLPLVTPARSRRQLSAARGSMLTGAANKEPIRHPIVSTWTRLLKLNSKEEQSVWRCERRFGKFLNGCNPDTELCCSGLGLRRVVYLLCKCNVYCFLSFSSLSVPVKQRQGNSRPQGWP